MKHKILSKYYTYIPGEFMPIYDGSELLNKKDFHIYKMQRAAWKVRNYRAVIDNWTHQQG